MKKIINSLIVVALVLSLAVSAFAAGSVVTVADAEGVVGGTVKVDVTVDNATFCGYDVKVEYDTAALKLKAITQGEYAGYFEGNAEAGLISYGNSKDVTVTGVLFTLEFEVLKEGNHEVSVKFDTLYAGMDMVDLDVTVKGGVVKSTCNHVYGEGTVITEATCTEGGLVKYVCSICGHEHTEQTKPLDHDWVFVELLENGELYRCSRCGEEYIEAVTGDMIGVVVALLAVSGLGITVLKKKEN